MVVANPFDGMLVVGVYDPPVLGVRDYVLDRPSVLLPWALNSFCQSSSLLSAGFLKGVIMSLPT